jgi:hypothetical protein
LRASSSGAPAPTYQANNRHRGALDGGRFPLAGPPRTEAGNREEPMTQSKDSTTIVGLFDFGIAAQNVAELREFYLALGFPLVFGDDQLSVLRVGAQEFGIHVQEQTPRGAFGFSVLVDDVEPLVNELAAAGIAFERHDEPFHAHLPGLTVEDPNGNTVHFLVKR